MDELVELPFSDWEKLRNLYKEKPYLPSSYNTIQNFIEWKKKEPQLPAKIFTLNGEWEDDGTFILEYESYYLLVFINTLDKNPERLARALNCFRTDRPISFFGIEKHVLPAVEQNYLHIGLKKEQFELDPSLWYYLPRGEALKFEVNPPAGILLRPLQIENAEQINDNWPYREPGSLKFIEQLIKSNLNVGAFDAQGNLLAWCLRLPLGSLGVVQVAEANKRQGLGSMVVRSVSKSLGNLGVDVTAPVLVENTPSRRMFEKLGFKAITKSYWLIRPAKVEK